jgi:hypothetical protein
MIKKLWNRIFIDKEQRAYNKMHRRHRKELVKLAKETGEWDWGWLHDMVLMQIKHMHEYYTANNCVWQSDETKLPIIEQLQHVLDLQKELDNLWDDATDIDEDADIEDWLNQKVSDEQREKWRLATERENELYKEIYVYIGENIQAWWD